MDLRSRRNMQIPDRADTVESVLQSCEGGRLWQQHEQPIQALVQIGVFLWFEKL
jgi:hypothetical protein